MQKGYETANHNASGEPKMTSSEQQETDTPSTAKTDIPAK